MLAVVFPVQCLTGEATLIKVAVDLTSRTTGRMFSRDRGPGRNTQLEQATGTQRGGVLERQRWHDGAHDGRREGREEVTCHTAGTQVNQRSGSRLAGIPCQELAHNWQHIATTQRIPLLCFFLLKLVLRNRENWQEQNAIADLRIWKSFVRSQSILACNWLLFFREMRTRLHSWHVGSICNHAIFPCSLSEAVLSSHALFLKRFESTLCDAPGVCAPQHDMGSHLMLGRPSRACHNNDFPHFALQFKKKQRADREDVNVNQMSLSPCHNVHSTVVRLCTVDVFKRGTVVLVGGCFGTDVRSFLTDL